MYKACLHLNKQNAGNQIEGGQKTHGPFTENTQIWLTHKLGNICQNLNQKVL